MFMSLNIIFSCMFSTQMTMVNNSFFYTIVYVFNLNNLVLQVLEDNSNYHQFLLLLINYGLLHNLSYFSRNFNFILI